ncbi:MAG: DUF4349 domain-containing protein, partial [Solirubrobacterales bacterium]
MTPIGPRLAFAGVIALVTLTGCGGGGASGASAGGSAADSVAASAPRQAGPPKARILEKAVGAAATVEQKAIIKNGDVSIRTADPQRARDRLDALLNHVRGSIDAEQTVYDAHGQIQDSHLVLRVPVDSFAAAMDGVEQLGTVV